MGILAEDQFTTMYQQYFALPAHEAGSILWHSGLSPTAEKVVNATEGLVLRFGYRGFSHNDVASMLAIKRASVQYHFPTKEQLIVVVVQRRTQGFLNSLSAISEDRDTARGKLGDFAELFQVNAQRTAFCLCGILAAERGAVPDSVAREVESFFSMTLNWLVNVVTEGQNSGELKSLGDARMLAEAFLCALEGALVVGRGKRLSGEPEVLGVQLISLMLA